VERENLQRMLVVIICIVMTIAVATCVQVSFVFSRSCFCRLISWSIGRRSWLRCPPASVAIPSS
jgi:hypothetical protein